MNYSLRRIMTILLLGSALVSVPALSLESIEEYTSYVLQQDLSLSGVQIDITSARNDLEEPSLLEASTSRSIPGTAIPGPAASGEAPSVHPCRSPMLCSSQVL